MKPITLLAVISLIFMMACGNQPAPETTDAPELSLLEGIDVSQYQEDINWTEVAAAGKSFAFMRATQGITIQDPSYPTNYSNAKAAGLTVGAYHYYQTNDDPQDQANNFIKAANLGSGDLTPVVDVEALAGGSEDNWTDDLQTFLDLLQKQYNITPIMYTDLNFANEYLSEFSSYPLWIAEYDVNAPTLPSGWNSYVFWQYSQNGQVSGVTKAVDLDRFQGTKTELKPYLIP